MWQIWQQEDFHQAHEKISADLHERALVMFTPLRKSEAITHLQFTMITDFVLTDL